MTETTDIVWHPTREDYVRVMQQFGMHLGDAVCGRAAILGSQLIPTRRQSSLISQGVDNAWRSMYKFLRSLGRTDTKDQGFSLIFQSMTVCQTMYMCLTARKACLHLC